MSGKQLQRSTPQQQGQYCIILSEQDMVCMIIAGMCDDQITVDSQVHLQFDESE